MTDWLLREVCLPIASEKLRQFVLFGGFDGSRCLLHELPLAGILGEDYLTQLRAPQADPSSTRFFVVELHIGRVVSRIGEAL